VNGRTIIFKPKASFISLSKDGIKSIGFLGEFIMLVTKKDILKVIAINLSEKTESYEMFLIIK
jgi:hypothetical protein